MAFTYSKLAEVTVGSGGVASIDFNNIPQNYNDLVLKISARTNRSDTSDNIIISFNGSTSSLSFRYLQGNGASATSSSGSTGYVGNLDANTATASTFGNAEIYIPNYSGNTFKSVSSDTVDETNATTAYATFTAQLWSNVTAISSINFKPQVGSLFQQHSTATLYGVKAEV
jgi:hypothetical protein